MRPDLKPPVLSRSGKRRWPVLLLLGVGVIAISALVGPVVVRYVRTERRLRQAEEALAASDHGQRRDNLARARELIAACLEARPKSAQLHFLAARAARRAGDVEDARNHLRQCEQLGWAQEATDLEKALLAAQHGDLASVEGALSSFVERDHPDKALILEALARGYLATYQLTRARDCLDRLLALQPDNAPTLAWRAQTESLLGKREAALRDYLAAIAIDPQDDESRTKAAEMLLAAERAAAALVHFTHLHERQPDNVEASVGLARCQAELGKPTEAAALLDQLLASHPDHAGALAARGKLALEGGDFTSARKWLERACELAPFDRETVYDLSRCLRRLGQPAQAQRMLDRVKRIDADRKQLDELKGAVLAHPQDAQPRCQMGTILLRNGQEKEGLRWLQSALRIDPRHNEARKALADFADPARRKKPDD